MRPNGAHASNTNIAFMGTLVRAGNGRVNMFLIYFLIYSTHYYTMCFNRFSFVRVLWWAQEPIANSDRCSRWCKKKRRPKRRYRNLWTHLEPNYRCTHLPSLLLFYWLVGGKEKYCWKCSRLVWVWQLQLYPKVWKCFRNNHKHCFIARNFYISLIAPDIKVFSVRPESISQVYRIFLIPNMFVFRVAHRGDGHFGIRSNANG